jgi:transcriptional regulator GlxA family with amidase domain
MARWDFRSQDCDEVQEFLGGVYAENEFRTLEQRGPSRTRIYGGDVGDIAQYNVSYSAPFTFLSETERESFLILSCTAGTAKFHRGGDAVDFRPGCVAPISATKESRVRSGDSFAHISTHIGAEAINSLCAKLLGHPLEKPVLFALAPFADELKAHWDLVVKSLNQLLDAAHPSSIAINNLKEYAVALLLEKHPHNYSACLERGAPVRAAVIHDAKRFIEQNAHRPITVSDVAAFAGCSVRALHEGFCEHLGLTPRACLYLERMALARCKLAGGGEESSAAEIAQSSGFVNFSQFEAAYKLRYEENPTEVFHRYFRWNEEEDGRGQDQSNGAASPAKIDLLRHHINASLGERITVEKLAAMVGMSSQSFAAWFKSAFKTTPGQYVLLERVKWARWLLANTNISISAIASQTGFSSQSHLTSALKYRDGQTPHALRKAARFA